MSAERSIIHLADLNQGDLIRAVAGTEPHAYKYDFLIEKPGVKPTVFMSQTNPDGTVVSPVTCLLEGVGRHLTMQQNPVQEREGQITISYGDIYSGGSLMVIDPKDKGTGRRFELMPACTSIEVYPNNPN